MQRTNPIVKCTSSKLSAINSETRSPVAYSNSSIALSRIPKALVILVFEVTPLLHQLIIPFAVPLVAFQYVRMDRVLPLVHEVKLVERTN